MQKTDVRGIYFFSFLGLEPVGDSIFTHARKPLWRVMMRSGAWRRAGIPPGIIRQGQIRSFCGDAFCCAWSKALRFSVNGANIRKTDGFHALRVRWINRGKDGWWRLCRVTSDFPGTPRNCCCFLLFLFFSLSVTTCCRQVTTRYTWICFRFLKISTTRILAAILKHVSIRSTASNLNEG